MSTTTTQMPAHVLQVRHDHGERYEITVRGHRILVDQPVDVGGENAAPTPVELFVASLAGCVAYYAGRFLARHGITREGLGVHVAYRMAADRPARVTAIDLTVTVPARLPADRRPALRAVIEHCTVHNSLVDPPSVRIDLAA
ncbi:hypothetical protein CS0771_54060 [Catellatospora sp. IY07-71]|uniref:OsmC family protein n=1 Tax=Catellatospora sp. IY07-71 TaxID=2728827 RepID=UPI001BB7CBEB|nr:OsmC family protein [Catellatospora sp. IY07-71]BCJ75862.1 hypothetical protein CS0771_54060 [Catellatospora sp. IY07-71]